MEQINNILANFTPISLEEMDAVQLLNRTDTKFVVHQNTLEAIFPELISNYFCLEIEGKRIAEYNTLYFDTTGFDFYLHHHNGKPNRYKVRIRKYVDSDLCFLEIKNKKKGRTVKSRIVIDDFEEHLSPVSEQFIEEIIPHHPPLETKLWNHFHRITLVNKSEAERLTLDIGLNFEWGNEKLHLQKVIIGEVKQEKVNRNSPFMQLLKLHQVRPMRISKYCTGAKLLYPELKNNRFKAKHLYINKLNT